MEKQQTISGRFTSFVCSDHENTKLVILLKDLPATSVNPTGEKIILLTV